MIAFLSPSCSRVMAERVGAESRASNERSSTPKPGARVTRAAPANPETRRITIPRPMSQIAELLDGMVPASLPQIVFSTLYKTQATPQRRGDIPLFRAYLSPTSRRIPTNLLTTLPITPIVRFVTDTAIIVLVPKTTPSPLPPEVWIGSAGFRFLTLPTGYLPKFPEKALSR